MANTEMTTTLGFISVTAHTENDSQLFSSEALTFLFGFFPLNFDNVIFFLTYLKEPGVLEREKYTAGDKGRVLAAIALRKFLWGNAFTLAFLLKFNMF